MAAPCRELRPRVAVAQMTLVRNNSNNARFSGNPWHVLLLTVAALHCVVFLGFGDYSVAESKPVDCGKLCEGIARVELIVRSVASRGLSAQCASQSLRCG